MFDTNDVFNEAVRDSRIHVEGSNTENKSLIGSSVGRILLLAGIAYLGFSYYNETLSIDKGLVVKNELIAKIQVKAEELVEPKLQLVSKLSNSEADYLRALRGIESELTEERRNVNLEGNEQMRLSSAMNALMEGTVLDDNTGYTKELRKEIGMEFDKAVENTPVIADNEKMKDVRRVVVKKGDTLQGISDKFYGDAMNYKRIIASNDSLILNDTIYEGQTILLPY